MGALREVGSEALPQEANSSVGGLKGDSGASNREGGSVSKVARRIRRSKKEIQCYTLAPYVLWVAPLGDMVKARISCSLNCE